MQSIIPGVAFGNNFPNQLQTPSTFKWLAMKTENWKSTNSKLRSVWSILEIEYCTHTLHYIYYHDIWQLWSLLTSDELKITLHRRISGFQIFLALFLAGKKTNHENNSQNINSMIYAKDLSFGWPREWILCNFWWNNIEKLNELSLRSKILNQEFSWISSSPAMARGGVGARACGSQHILSHSLARSMINVAISVNDVHMRGEMKSICCVVKWWVSV